MQCHAKIRVTPCLKNRCRAMPLQENIHAIPCDPKIRVMPCRGMPYKNPRHTMTCHPMPINIYDVPKKLTACANFTPCHAAPKKNPWGATSYQNPYYAMPCRAQQKIDATPCLKIHTMSCHAHIYTKRTFLAERFTS